MKRLYGIAANLNPESPSFVEDINKINAGLKGVSSHSSEIAIIKNRVGSVCSSLKDGSISKKAAYKALAGIAGDMKPFMEKERNKEVTAAPKIMLKELADLEKVKDRFKKVDHTLKSFGVEVDDYQRKQDSEWLDHVRKEGQYEDSLDKDASKQGAILSDQENAIPKYSVLQSKIKKQGWTWVKSPLLVVFGTAPTSANIARSRIKIENLTMGHHATERLRGETGKLGSIIEDQIVLVFPRDALADSEEFESDKDIAISSLSMRLGDLEIVSKVGAPKKLGRATEPTKVDFSPLAPPAPPVEPDPPKKLLKKDSENKTKVRAYARAKKKYDEAMEAFKAALPEYNKKLEKYEKDVEARNKAISDIKKKETSKLAFDANSYFRSPLYPKMVFIWVMRKSVLNTLMPMRVKDIGFPSLKTEVEMQREEKISGSAKKVAAIRNHVLDMVRVAEESLKVSASALEALKIAYGNKLTQLKSQKPNTPMFNMLQKTLAALKVQIDAKSHDVETAKRSIPDIIKSVKEMEQEANNLVKINK